MRPPFPLPLTPFEYYYWCDDRPECPMTFPGELHFAGRLEREPFCRALGLVTARHPLLTARIDSNGRRPQWIAGEAAAVDWDDEDAPVAFHANGAMDLTRDAGMRVFVRAARSAPRIHFQYHHIVCDGLSCGRIAAELMLAYHAIVCGQEPAAVLKPLDGDRLRERGAMGQERLGWRDWAVLAACWGPFLFQSATPLAVPSCSEKDGALQPLEFTTRTFDESTAARLRRVAVARGGSLNDLFLRDMFVVLRRWNARHGDTRPRLRINMPASLMTRDDLAAPVANALSFTFLTRRADACDTPDELFDSIHRETEAIRRQRLGRYFVAGLAIGRRIPGLVPWMMRRRTSFATVVLSNLGRPFQRLGLPRRDGLLVCGDAVLLRVLGVPPIRPLTRAALVVTNYGGETAFSLRCDPQCFRRVQAAAFLNEYIAELEASAEGNVSCRL